MRWLAILAFAGCGVSDDARERQIVDTLATDNYNWCQREPELVRMKLHKMQRGPFEWLRGTAALYWRDVTEPGADRPTTNFGDPLSSRVLLVGDPHAENLGTFRAADGTMFMDWNDFDATGYGPYGADLRRLGTSLAIIAEIGDPGNDALAKDLIRIVAKHYAESIALQATGTRIGTIGLGATQLFDKELTKARENGDMHVELEKVAPVVGTMREIKYGDVDPMADDGVIEDRLAELSVDEVQQIDDAIGQWQQTAAGANTGAIKLRARRIGAGVASYAALRYEVVLEGPTIGEQNDILVELKEQRDGVIIHDVPHLASAEWTTPAARAVNTQHRLQARPDADAHLGHAELGGLSLKIRDREQYQRGINATDLEAMATKDLFQLRTTAGVYGELLARAHGQAATQDGYRGYKVIAPLLAGHEDAFADELVEAAFADAQRTLADYQLMKDRDLAADVMP